MTIYIFFKKLLEFFCMYFINGTHADELFFSNYSRKYTKKCKK